MADLNVYDCIFGDFPTKNTVHTVWFWPTQQMCACSRVRSSLCAALNALHALISAHIDTYRTHTHTNTQHSAAVIA